LNSERDIEFLTKQKKTFLLTTKQEKIL